MRLLLKRVGIGHRVSRSVPTLAASVPFFGGADPPATGFEFLFVQIYLAIEEQIGLRMSNEVKPRLTPAAIGPRGS